MLVENAKTDQPISIHALLAESDYQIRDARTVPGKISIHALLAESDSYEFEV